MRINSIFLSVDGEVNFKGQGHPSIFIRLQGCNLASRPCYYCDTKESLDPADGKEMSVFKVRDMILDYLSKEMKRLPKITITGGEPLMQREELQDLLTLLKPLQIPISIETNGTIDFRELRKGHEPGLCLVVDYKCNRVDTLDLDCYRALAPWDWVKFVVCDHSDYLEAVKTIRKMKTHARLAISPVHKVLHPSTVWEWIKRDGLLDVTLNVQLHKLISLD